MEKIKNNITELVFILDRSGSMSELEADTIGGFNATIEKQKKVDGSCYVSTVLFANRSAVIHDRVDLENIKLMTDRDYCVGGGTALLDAIGGAIHHIGKWVTDISYIQTKQGFLYLSMIKDLYDNSIVDYKYATQMPASLVIETVHAAVKNAKPSGGFILHSDNGFQYTSQAYYNVAKAKGIKPSMSSVRCPYDNACAENFFSMLKTECIYRAKPQTFDEAKELVDEYIYFYNNERIQLKTGQTPMGVRYAYAA